MNYRDLDSSVLSSFVDYDSHECIRKFEDPQTGLKAFIAVHNTNLGPALGGCRMYPYADEADAIRDVLRLSKGMTYKNALAGLPLGGGKSVIIGNPQDMKTASLIAAMGKAVHTLEGRYITAEDSGTNVADMEVMAAHTPYVMGRQDPDSALGGDPSPKTAYGVFCGMRAAVRHRYQRDDMRGMTVAVQGLGAVGFDLCRRLHEQGASLIVTDIQSKSLDRARDAFGDHVRIVSPDDIFGVEADIFAPCAMGAQINQDTIARLKVGVIAGAANNQLATPQDAARLEEKHILYAPDYAINAGGVIAVAYEYLERTGKNTFAHDLSYDNMVKHVEQIEKTLDRIFNIADARGVTPDRAADELAEMRFMKAESQAVMCAE